MNPSFYLRVKILLFEKSVYSAILNFIKSRKAFAWVLLLFLISFSCKKDVKENPVTTSKLSSGLVLSHIDSTIAPGNDFSGFANGKWYKTADYLPGLPLNGGMIKLNFDAEDQIGEILQDVLKEPDQPTNTPKGQIQAFYRSYIDTTTRNQLGIKPIKVDIEAVAAVKSHSEMASLMGQPFMPSIFGGYVFLDAKDTSRYVYIMGQKDLGMGTIEYYLSTDAPNPAVRSAYIDYAEKLFNLAGIQGARKKAETVLDIETKLASKYWTNTQKRDPNKMYHLMTVAELKEFAPGFDWGAYLQAKGMENANINVNTDTAIQGIATVFKETSLDDLKSLETFYLLNSNAKYLSDDFIEAEFEFFKKTLLGIQEGRTLEAKAKSEANSILAWQLGSIYADKYYTPEVEKQIVELVEFMKKAIEKRLNRNDWMDAETKAEALKKFNNIHWKIGRPERVIDQSGLNFKADDLIGNLKETARLDAKDFADRLTEPKREWEWLMPPQIVNAYYQSEMNDVVLPIGILQSPTFDPKADPASNFGGILSIVGHEVGHGFDDKGSQSDANGLLRNWWTDQSREEFARRANMLVEQYNQYEAAPGVFLNGKLTLGENIGDVGGVALAYSAYRDYVNEKQGGQAPIIDGLTGDQRFFLANAQMWSWMTTDAFARNAALTDNHSPGQFRANGVFRNMDVWYEAFNVQPGDSLYLAPKDRVEIW